MSKSAASLTLVVRVDDLVACMKRNARDAEMRRRHELRFDRPLDGLVAGKPHVHEEGNYWSPDIEPPLTLTPEAFVDPDGNVTSHPLPWQVHEAAQEVDGVDDLEAVSDETLNECWEVHLEVWEAAVRGALRDRIDISGPEYDIDVDPRVVDVEYVEADDE